MKQALQLFIITLLIVSCTKKQSNQIEQYDSMIFTDAEIRNQEIQDSLQQARLDSLALIAWGDAKFGMSMKETLSTNAFKNGIPVLLRHGSLSASLKGTFEVTAPT